MATGGMIGEWPSLLAAKEASFNVVEEETKPAAPDVVEFDDGDWTVVAEAANLQPPQVTFRDIAARSAPGAQQDQP
eukprot:CAMPEP_0204285948 /NCGR_PEP_ID=MMETSP0468-20130131/51770_1 /ASSEMBLY_ACC=CAM_ASM_000383 /TAXON_ID=2969 /ORGANISM="Oxyrrhis marina" /LENGTH=75 /DNA_ID=CAMNT_0051263815 /DNA_START=34 /DNA_END=261 /DNA_ORIENTATION=+